MARVAAAHREGTAYTELLARQAELERVGAGDASPAEAAAASAGMEAAREEAQAKAARAIPLTIVDHVRTAATGLAIVFVPVAVVEAVSNVEITGNRRFLSIVDLDTIFLDAGILAVLVLLWKRRHGVGDRLPFVVFCLILSGTTALLLGYVVTNFGTLWRMRPMVALPLWMLVAALPPRGEDSDNPQDAKAR